MPFKMFDPSRLILKPLGERIHDIDLCKVLVPVDDSPASLDNEKIRSVAGAMVAAKKANAAILLMYGAHVIRSGCSACMIELMRRGLVTHLATNGAGSIHDFEFSLIGKTFLIYSPYRRPGTVKPRPKQTPNTIFDHGKPYLPELLPMAGKVFI